ncbi:hypothetical protein KR067_012361 [Drosophila pandora]|nr:hypothetical protein KR067_012361 [Drosophila pandora]
MPSVAATTTTTATSIAAQIADNPVKIAHKCLHLPGRTMSSDVNGCGHCPVVPIISEPDRRRIQVLQDTAFSFFTETLHRYGVEELIFCFNGGKDCTVLLDLLMSYLRQECISSQEIPMLYIKSGDSFPEIDDFVASCIRNYRVRLVEYDGSLKEALTHMQEDMPKIKAVFVGSRNTDPYCQNLAPMQPTDSDWPPMMRLNPLLEWTYHDVWHYIHINSVPYCSLYDRGYTSIGNRSNTVPNPHLRRPAADSCGCSGVCNSIPATTSQPSTTTGSYRPAWELADPKQERAGRLPRK